MNPINPIELNNIRVLSITYEKLLCIVSEEQADILRNNNLEVKELNSDEYGTSYSIPIKCASDKMCSLYKTINRSNITKGCYDICGVVANWTYSGKEGIRLDGYFIRKLEAVIPINPTLKRMCGTMDLDGTSREGEITVPTRKIKKIVKLSAV